MSVREHSETVTTHSYNKKIQKSQKYKLEFSVGSGPQESHSCVHRFQHGGGPRGFQARTIQETVF